MTRRCLNAGTDYERELAVLREPERERPLLLERERLVLDPPREPAAERRAEVLAAFAPERAPVAAAFVARRAPEAALRAVLRADVVVLRPDELLRERDLVERDLVERDELVER